MLLNNGADINAVSHGGLSALHVAASKKCYFAVFFGRRLSL